MLNIKQYTDGRFFDTVNKKFLKPEQMAELIKKGEALCVVMTRTGKDITDAVVAEFAKKTGTGKTDSREKTGEKAEKKAGEKTGKKTSGRHEVPFLNTDTLKKWVGDAIDKRIGKILDAINLPTKDQVTQLDNTIQELNRKIEALEALNTARATEKKTAAPRKKRVKKEPAPAAESPAAPEVLAADPGQETTRE